MNDILNKYFSNNHLGHAYLLKTDDYSKVFDIVKFILKNNNNAQNIEKLIDENAYSDLKIVESDGQWIKKEQIISLKDEFKTKSTYNNKRIYIIRNAENLNKSSGNTLLKFLEEPEDNIIALLLTNNKNKVLDTIVSRCQYIKLDSNVEIKQDNVNEQAIINFVEIIETKEKRATIELLSVLEEFNDRLEVKKFLTDVINYYEQIMLSFIDLSELDIKEKIDKIIKNNTIETVKKKIEALIFVIDALEYNINMKLLVDKLIILMFGVD